ncbi:MAG: flagellin [Chloroflexota bacterium]
MAQGDFTRINTNVGALNALNSLKNVQKQLGMHQLRLATGKRINEAADDPAGMTIATKFEYRASGLGVALDNIGDAKNMMAVAEGGLSKIKDILILMRGKAEAAASDTLGSEERTAIATQLADFKQEIDNIIDTTQWNGKKMLDGLSDFSSKIVFQVGADTDVSNQISLSSSSFGSVSTGALGVALIDVDTADDARAYMGKLGTAISTMSTRLQTVGSYVSRMNFREETVTIAKVNVEAAHNRIMNADMAFEQLEATKMQILQQTATAMLAQANTAPQNVLSLFR